MNKQEKIEWYVGDECFVDVEAYAKRWPSWSEDFLPNKKYKLEKYWQEKDLWFVTCERLEDTTSVPAHMLIKPNGEGNVVQESNQSNEIEVGDWVTPSKQIIPTLRCIGLTIDEGEYYKVVKVFVDTEQVGPQIIIEDRNGTRNCGSSIRNFTKQSENKSMSNENDMSDVIGKLRELKERHDFLEKNNAALETLQCEQQQKEKKYKEQIHELSNKVQSLMNDNVYKDRRIVELHEYIDEIEQEMKNQSQKREWKVGDEFVIDMNEYECWDDRNIVPLSENKIYKIQYICSVGQPYVVIADDERECFLEDHLMIPVQSKQQQTFSSDALDVFNTLVEMTEEIYKYKSLGQDVYEVEITANLKQRWEKSGIPFTGFVLDKYPVHVFDILEDEDGNKSDSNYLICYDEPEIDELNVNLHENMTPEELNESLQKAQQILAMMVAQTDENTKKKPTIRYSTQKEFETTLNVWKVIFILVSILTVIGAARYYVMGKF